MRPRKALSPPVSVTWPGAYLWLGQGRGEQPLHHPCYDFNDELLPMGVRWFCEVAERSLGSH